jgi:hypothetical protein
VVGRTVHVGPCNFSMPQRREKRRPPSGGDGAAERFRHAGTQGGGCQ